MNAKRHWEHLLVDICLAYARHDPEEPESKNRSARQVFAADQLQPKPGTLNDYNT
jgi:hypothetical protein